MRRRKKPKQPKQPKGRKPKGRKPRRIKVKRPLVGRRPRRAVPVQVQGPAKVVVPPAAQQREAGRPANNTTCDIYYSPHVPPAAPDVAGVACALVARFVAGSEASEGDQTFRWTHLLYLDADVDVRDTYPNAPAHRIYVPDKNGTGFDIVFVELVNRGTPARYRRVFLDRRAPSWPTGEL